MKKAEKIIGIIFIIVSVLALGEFLFVRGMFTWLMAMGAVVITGIPAIITAIINKNYRLAITDAMFITSLAAGYMFLG